MSNKIFGPPNPIINGKSSVKTILTIVNDPNLNTVQFKHISNKLKWS